MGVLEMIIILVLLLAFQVKHLLADYYWQEPYMYENKGKSVGWFKPLLYHAIVHGAITLAIIVCTWTLNQELSLWTLLLVLFDMSTHFIIDRWKAIQPETPSESKFWINLGIDQMLHHIVGIVIVAIIVSGIL
jgi:hypothetical protein